MIVRISVVVPKRNSVIYYSVIYYIYFFNENMGILIKNMQEVEV